MSDFKSIIARAAETFGSYPFIVTPDRILNFDQLVPELSRYGGGLILKNVGAEDRIGLVAANSIDSILALLSIIDIGAVACPISVRFPSLMISSIAERLNLKMILTDRRSHLPESVRSIEIDKITAEIDAHGPTWDDNPDQIATVMLTSGSTSTPKAVAHTVRQHYFNALGVNRNIPFAPGDRWLLSLPLYHVGGLAIIFRALLGGGAVVIPDQSLSLNAQIHSGKITHLSVVNTQLRSLVRQARQTQDYASLKAIIVGGGPQDSVLVNMARQSGWPIATTYGLTEMGSMVTCSMPTKTVSSVVDSGSTLAYRELKLSDTGEILVRGECLMSGYIENDKIVSDKDGEGWFHTGDVGKLCDDGAIRVVGRQDNMFISGGENIHPEQIEAALKEIEGIDEVVVVPIPDDKFGFRPVAFVKCDTAHPFELDSLAGTLAQRLPRFMTPVRFLAWPRSLEETGLKVSRARLKQIAKDKTLS